MLFQFLLVFTILGLGMYYSVRTNKMNVPGALSGGLLGMLLFLGAGFTGLAQLGFFFLAGSFVTAWKLNYKVSLGLAEENKGQRTASQAWANAGVAGLVGLCSWLAVLNSGLGAIMIAASFAAATSDTFSSELGNIYGRNYYNVLTLKLDTRGLNGVISLEGTLFGFLGSTLIAIIYSCGYGWGWETIWIILAGVIGNLADSVLGATWERKHYLTNDAVNFLNTLMGAFVAGFLYFMFD